MEITAAVVEATSGPFVLEAVELSHPRTDEVLVELSATGLCHSDLSVVKQATPFPLPAVLGHEGVGIVQDVGGGVTDLVPGDRVVLSFTYCGHCRACRGGHPVYCDDWLPLNLLGGSRGDGSSAYSRAGGSRIHGHFFGQSSFATHTVVNARAAIKAPEDLELESLAPLGCSVQTGVGAVLNVARPRPGSNLVIFGAGGVGLSAVMGAHLTPASRVIAVDVNAERLKLAAELGATHTVNSQDEDPVGAILEITSGGADVVIETSGRVAVLAQAMRCLRATGTCIVIGAPPFGTQLPVDVPDLLGRGIRLVGTNQGDSAPRDMIPRLFELIRAGALPVRRLITEYPFEEINRAAEGAQSGRAIKPVLRFH
jgi:aryl-alcohol dehydrogenase